MFSSHTNYLVKELINKDIPIKLWAFYVLLKDFYYSDVFLSIVSPAIDNLKTYDRLLSLEDFSSIMIEQACGALALSQHDYGMLVACYGEVDVANKPMYNREVFADMLEKTDFYDRAILDGSIEQVVRLLKKHAREEYRLSWYEDALNVVIAKKELLRLAQKSKQPS